jgi:hypothetical protein
LGGTIPAPPFARKPGEGIGGGRGDAGFHGAAMRTGGIGGGGGQSGGPGGAVCVAGGCTNALELFAGFTVRAGVSSVSETSMELSDRTSSLRGCAPFCLGVPNGGVPVLALSLGEPERGFAVDDGRNAFCISSERRTCRSRSRRRRSASLRDFCSVSRRFTKLWMGGGAKTLAAARFFCSSLNTASWTCSRSLSSMSGMQKKVLYWAAIWKRAQQAHREFTHTRHDRRNHSAAYLK